MHAPARQSEAFAHALEGGRHPQQIGAAEGRHIERLGLVDRREQGVAQQFPQLAARIGAALPEGGRLQLRPDAAPIGHHDEHPPAGGQDAPDFRKQFAGRFAQLQRMHHQHPVDAGVGQGHHGGVDEGGGGGAILRPVDHALLGGHEGEHPHCAVAKAAQIGRGVAHPQHGQARAILPPPPDDRAHESMGHPAKGRGVEGAQIDDVEGHALLLALISGRGEAPPAKRLDQTMISVSIPAGKTSSTLA